VGAANVLAAFKLYAGKVPPTSLNVLAYMAAVALDKDAEPRFWEGHAILAIRCLGSVEPVSEADLRGVRRAITPLFTAGAITVDRHSTGHRGKAVTVRYRLWLVCPAPVENRQVRKSRVGRKPSGAEAGIGRKAVLAQDEKRPAKEYGGALKAGARPHIDLFVRRDVEVGSRGGEIERQRQLDGLTAWMREHMEAG
jgi:hypothetical protein